MIASILLWVWVAVWGTLHRAVRRRCCSCPFNPLVDPKRRVILFMSGLWGWGVLLYVQAVPAGDDRRACEKINGPCMLCPNHDSVADIITFLGVLPNIAFVAQNYVFFIPPARVFRRDCPTTFGRRPRRAGRRCSSIASKWLGRGVPVLMFPEGTRSPDGDDQAVPAGPVRGGPAGEGAGGAGLRSRHAHDHREGRRTTSR